MMQLQGKLQPQRRLCVMSQRILPYTESLPTSHGLNWWLEAKVSPTKNLMSVFCHVFLHQLTHMMWAGAMFHYNYWYQSLSSPQKSLLNPKNTTLLFLTCEDSLCSSKCIWILDKKENTYSLWTSVGAEVVFIYTEKYLSLSISLSSSFSSLPGPP